MSTLTPKNTEKDNQSNNYNDNCNNSDLFILALSKNLSYDELIEYRKNYHNRPRD